MSLRKYLIRKDIFLVHSMQLQPHLKFGEECQIVEKDDVISIGIPRGSKESEDYNSMSEFLDALLEPYLPKYDKNLTKDFFLYKNFIWSLSLNPLFFRYIIKQTRKIQWIKNHRSELAYLLLLDILSEAPPTIKNANQEFDQDYRDEDRTRQRRLLRNEYYPELFFKTEEYIEKRVDTREKQYSTIATENTLDFGEKYMASVPLMMELNNHFTPNLPSQKEQERMQNTVRCIGNVTVDNIQDAIEFRKEIQEALDRVLLRVHKYDGFRRIIVEEIRKKTDIIDQIRVILNIAIYVRWFNLKSRNERKKIFKQTRKLKYSEREAQKIVSLLLEYTNDPEEVETYLYFGEHAFTGMNKSKYAKLLKKERKKLERSRLKKD